MINFKATIHQYKDAGEKTGWTYIFIPAEISTEIYPGNKKTYRIKGQLDAVSVQQIAVMPVGEGNFILPLNAKLRKQLRKTAGANVQLLIERDDAIPEINADLLDCIEDNTAARTYFESLSPGHKRYFSNWISEARTVETKAKRLAATLSALERNMEYGPMIRELKAKKQNER